MKTVIGAEIWRESVVHYYAVKTADIAHFLAADGASLDDYSMAHDRPHYRRMILHLDPLVDVQAAADEMGVTWESAYAHESSRPMYNYYKGWNK